MDPEAGSSVYRDQMFEGEVLGVFEADKSVDDDVTERRRSLDELSMEEQAVSSEAGELGVDGSWGAAEGAGDLAVGHPAD